MAVRVLKIRKSLSVVQGRTKPLCEARAFIPAGEQAMLLQHFGNEPLFKRTSYANGFDDGEPPSPALSKMLVNFVKNDACPEVLVKNLLLGQRFETNTLWDVLCFEFIVKRAFNGLIVLCEGINTFDHTLLVTSGELDAVLIPDIEAFVADAEAEVLKLAS